MDRRVTFGVAASCVLHASCAWFALRPHAHDASRADARHSLPIEVELLPEPAIEPVPVPEPWAQEPAEPNPVAPAPAPTQPRSARAPHPSAPADTPPRSPSALPAPAATEALETSGGGWSLHPSLTTRAELFPAPNHAAAASPRAAGERERPRATAATEAAQASQTGGLREALAEADARRGMARGGAVVSAVHHVSHLAPAEGRLTVRVRLDPLGQPREVQVLHRTGDGASWDSFVQALQAQLRRKPARALTDGSSELHVTVRVDASQVLPSGQAGGPVQAQGLGGTFDLSDVGARARKRVQAHLLDERSVR